QRLAPGEFPEKQPLDRELNGDSVEHNFHPYVSVRCKPEPEIQQAMLYINHSTAANDALFSGL
ncbi:hypothetical protein, partial [Cronobacter muytjensii]